MHELSLASALVATVEKFADGHPVTTVNVRIGRLRQVVPDSLEFYFEVVARGTVCEGSRLELEVVPARLHCSACRHEWELTEPPFWCPRCSSHEVTVAGGDEFLVESIEIEEEACIART
jgi:hydrogenase nickel incorporation protein HypA/HybF